MKSAARDRFILIATVSYTALALAWIFLSDQLLSIFADIESIVWLSTAKGVFFVIATAAIFFLTLRAVPAATTTGNDDHLTRSLLIGVGPAKSSSWQAYLFALAVTLAMLLFSERVAPAISNQPMFILLMFPIVLSALLGGLWPGLLSTAVTALVLNYQLLPPIGSFRIAASHDLLQWGFLIVNGVAVSMLSSVLRQTLARAEMNRRLLGAVISGTSDAVFVKDERGRYLLANAAACQFVGKTPEELVGHDDYAAFPEDTARELMAIDKAIMMGGRTQTHEENLTTLEGEKLVFLVTKGPVFDAAGRTVGLFGISHNITDRKQAELELRIAAAAFESQESMMVTDANEVILRVNRAFTETTGYTAAEAVGRTPRMLRSARHGPEFFKEMWESIARTGSWQGEIWDRRKSGEEYLKWLTISAVKGEDGRVTHYVGTHFDISERKQAEQKIRDLAFFDQLTALPNRALLMERMKHAMAASSRNGQHGALLFIDLDNFKVLNDTLGHQMGDLLLQQVAKRLLMCVREGDTVARLGGDEFVVLLDGLSTSERDAAARAETVAGKILSTLDQTYSLGEQTHHSTASIGVTLFLGHRKPIEELLKQADLSMYRSKEAGRNAVHFFDPAMEAILLASAALEDDLRHALDEGQFMLHYQAQMMRQGRLTGAEVLVRWQHPKRGVVSPAEFIPLAETNGLILPLGQWVLETACAQLAAWATDPRMEHLTVAVNVSARQFRQRDFVDQVVTALRTTGANPNRLKLELTESLLVSNIEEIVEKMFALKAMGVGFSLDDFGTGYSSLAYLKRLPLDQLKIDQSFVRDVLVDANDAAIARTIVALAQSLGLGVIAEGVETATQMDFLASVGCDAYQGYYFSRPLPLGAFEEFALLPTLQ